LAKGKDHKRYEFGRKAWVAMNKTHGVIVGALSYLKNIYDGHTIPEVLNLVKWFPKPQEPGDLPAVGEPSLPDPHLLFVKRRDYLHF